MKTAVFFLMCVFTFSSCYEITAPEEEKLLYGSWTLTRISGGFSGHGNVIVDPGEKVVFTYGGTVNFYSKEGLKNSTSFTLKKGKSIYSQDEVCIIHFADSSYTPRVILSLSEDSLQLGDNMFDGFFYHYKKER